MWQCAKVQYTNYIQIAPMRAVTVHTARAPCNFGALGALALYIA